MVGQQTSLPVAGLGVQLHDPEDVLGPHLGDALLQKGVERREVERMAEVVGGLEHEGSHVELGELRRRHGHFLTVFLTSFQLLQDGFHYRKQVVFRHHCSVRCPRSQVVYPE